MLIPSTAIRNQIINASLSRRVNANSQPRNGSDDTRNKLIKKGEC